MSQIDWKRAHYSATHAMTTAENWDGRADLKGTIDFATACDGCYYDKNGHEFCTDVGGWVVISERPVGAGKGGAA